MSKRILKYVVPVDGKFHHIDLPYDEPIRGALCQDGALVRFADARSVQFWMVVDDQEPVFRRIFTVVGTGQPLDDVLKYQRIVNSFVIQGPLGMVWHLLELEDK